MDKVELVNIVKRNKRGMYNLLVDEYWTQYKLATTNVSIVLELISDDLEKHTGQKVILKYISLCQAIARVRGHKTRGTKTSHLAPDKKGEYDFKNSYEIENNTKTSPGRFTD